MKTEAIKNLETGIPRKPNESTARYLSRCLRESDKMNRELSQEYACFGQYEGWLAYQVPELVRKAT